MRRFLLEWVERGFDSEISGSEISARLKKDFDRLLKDRIIEETRPAEEVACPHSCERDCGLAVRRQGDKIILACPNAEVRPRQASPDEIRQFKLNLSNFVRRVCQQNGIKNLFKADGPFECGIFRVGEKDFGAETVAVCMAAGLTGQNCLKKLLFIRLHIKEDRVVVLIPAHRITDIDVLNRLALEHVYPITMMESLETATTFLIRKETLERLLFPPEKEKQDCLLVVDKKRWIILYKNKAVTLQPLPFKFFLLLAERPGEVVKRKYIYDTFWGDYALKTDNPLHDRQIDQHLKAIRRAFRELSRGKNGIPKEEIAALFKTHKKVGFRLNIPKEQVRIE